jgi:hypothetical protein
MPSAESSAHEGLELVDQRHFVSLSRIEAAPFLDLYVFDSFTRWNLHVVSVAARRPRTGTEGKAPGQLGGDEMFAPHGTPNKNNIVSILTSSGQKDPYQRSEGIR